MRIGYLGLGKMGKNMVSRLLSQGIEVVVWNRSPEPVTDVVKEGAIAAGSIQDVAEKLQSPRTIWLMLPAGVVVDQILTELLPTLSSGDLVIDGGNSFYKDTLRRAKLLSEKNIRFMDIGVSGGPAGAKNGACLMIGGGQKDFDSIQQLFEAIAAPDAFGLLGPTGAGHFAKMIHNGIEYGMMEAIAEGAELLKHGPFTMDLSETFRIYNNKSVIESRLVGWTQEALTENPELAGISSHIGQLGEGRWTVETAKELHREIPVIDASLAVRDNSSKEQDSFRNKIVSALRGKFGGHTVTTERKT